jgi:hypothetical protein
MDACAQRGHVCHAAAAGTAGAAVYPAAWAGRGAAAGGRWARDAVRGYEQTSLPATLPIAAGELAVGVWMITEGFRGGGVEAYGQAGLT